MRQPVHDFINGFPPRLNLRRRGLLIVAAVPLLLAACGEKAPGPTAKAPYRPVANTHELMEWILEPAVDVIWDSAGFIITDAGTEDLSPTTDEGWEEVVRAAVTLSEGGNLLMLPGRAVGEDWVEYSQAMIAASELALQAARAKDAEALFDAGGRIYQVCRACHNQYWVKGE